MNDKVINLAGVMGAKNTACSSEILHQFCLECAHFLTRKIMGKVFEIWNQFRCSL